MSRLRFHYGWVVALVTFLILLVTAGIRATPGILILSLENEFGWSRAVISAAIAINIALFGLIGPFAASVMDRWGLRRTVLGALTLLAASVALTTGWIGASHQLGASLAAFSAGTIRMVWGTYSGAFWIAGALCVVAGLCFVPFGRRVFHRAPPPAYATAFTA